MPPATVCTGRGCAIDQAMSGSALPLSGVLTMEMWCAVNYASGSALVGCLINCLFGKRLDTLGGLICLSCCLWADGPAAMRRFCVYEHIRPLSKVRVHA